MKEDIAAAIIRLRDKCGLNQAQLARLARVAPQTLSDIENAKTKPGVDILLQLVRAMGITPDDLFREAGLIPGRVGEDRVTYGDPELERLLAYARSMDQRQRRFLADVAESMDKCFNCDDLETVSPQDT